MKKIKKIILLILVLLLICGCSGKFTFETSIKGEKIGIKVNDAQDSEAGETLEFEVMKNRVLNITSSLDKGEMKLDFVNVTIFTNEDGPDDVIVNEVVESITISGNETIELELNPDYYIIQFTSIGNSNGSIDIDINKKN